MARVKGVNIPDNKNIVTSLTYIHGIGKVSAEKILAKVGIDPLTKTGSLDNDKLGLIRDEINNYVVEGDLRRTVNLNIKGLMEIGCYRGIRHKKGLPVRGQSTRSNARTRKGKGKTVANKKK